VLGRAQLLPIVLVVVCVLGSLLTRAWRWQVFFLPDRHVSFGPLLGTLAISYMASTFLPLRAGELVRAVFLGQRESLPVPRIVGTILLEKLFDFLAIGVMLALLVLLSPLTPEAILAGRLIVTVILVGFGFVVVLAVWRAPTLSLLRMIEARLPFGIGHRLQLEEAARHFAEGTDSLREPRLWVRLVAWTTITWLFSVGSALGGTLALGVQPGLPALLFLIVLTSSGQAVPSSPGYVGVYHALAFLALTTFGVEPDLAAGSAVLTWTFSYAALVIVGIIAMWVGGYKIGDVLAAVRGQKAPVGAMAPDAWPLAPDP
jgi:uncharacterized protein (TIRG00374 family)